MSEEAAPRRFPRPTFGVLVLAIIAAVVLVQAARFSADWIAYRTRTTATMVFKFDPRTCRDIFGGARAKLGGCVVRAPYAWQRMTDPVRLVVFLPDGRAVTIPNTTRDLVSLRPEPR